MLPGALRVGAPGYIGTLGVRLLHARVRYVAMRDGFADRQFGMAINQVDLGRTWMDFTLTAWRAEGMLGYGLTRLETAQLFKVWWHIGHLLGVDARLIEGITDLEQAARVDALFQAVTGPKIPEAQVLAQATIDTIKEELQTALRLPKPLGQRALSGLARRFHGNAVADDLLIPPAPITDPIVSGAIELIQRSRTKTRKNSAKWEQMIEKNMVALKEQLATLSPQAEYEQGTT